MIKVITYGTYDCLHYGHIRLLQHAKALGDFLIVGITSEDFDVNRGKINVKQSLTDRIAAVKETGIADLIVVEEYQGQKIDDIQRYGVDIFTVGSDWEGHFDYLNEYCQVVYLPRTKGVSSTELRSDEQHIRMGVVGESSSVIEKFLREGGYVNGLEFTGVCTSSISELPDYFKNLDLITNNYDELLANVEAVYIQSSPYERYALIQRALEYNVHVICESPITLAQADYLELLALAESKNLVLMESLKTAYTVAFQRMVVMLKSGLIGRIASVDAAVTSLAKLDGNSVGSLCDWGPQALLAIFKLLGTAYESKSIKTMFYKGDTVDDIGEEKSVKRYKIDSFTKIDFIYPEAVASLRVGKGVKSEGELIISGTKGYIFVPAPWWKTDYFEARFEDPRDNRKFFYQLKGEGIRNMIVQFVRSVSEKRDEGNVLPEITSAITKVIQDFYQGIDVIEICK